MSEEALIPLIFEEDQDLLNNPEILDKYSDLVDYGFATKRFLYLDHRGEENQEIVNYILDYEFAHDLELASEEELEQLGEFEYEYVPEKIKEVNKLISPKGYGLFYYPTGGDFCALFISKLEHKSKLLEVEIVDDEWTPIQERYIQYFEYVLDGRRSE
ncbi:hypothetical protein GNQ08_05565 [Paenibacillus macerans]|uniref:DUF6630 domain-containing protein n=1 Tax=Paenibacillus macerans TaxID=44252 RepID=A0A6N8EQI8_PAEMA|nr:hypothetical protein [Paenibacillus macerans]MUG21895.1 hypothetical protein [Paenibacillus macerans]OMG46542.1 hypothetical protein BK140_26580 [Paenibacillus macerans]